ncbi:hypothetical protein AAG747_14200 [Rapidithrix thailandica]|uniref:Uncharacterized protein n=1 Tax=Rapidithrix thailandica TaxID=413964 RepID=A0AAW9S1L8_9BACT
MELTSLFPSSDNLYKFLFMGGVFMIVFSFIYPLEKKQKLELEINIHNKDTEILNLQIQQLKEDVGNLKLLTKETLSKLENKTKSELDTKKIEQLKSNYNKEFEKIKTKELDILTKKIVINYNKSKIKILNEHINSFDIFKDLFLAVGSLFSLFGLYKWFRVTNMTEKLQKDELKKVLQKDELN